MATKGTKGTEGTEGTKGSGVVGFKKSNLVPPGTKFDFETFWRRFVEDA